MFLKIKNIVDKKSKFYFLKNYYNFKQYKLVYNTFYELKTYYPSWYAKWWGNYKKIAQNNVGASFIYFNNNHTYFALTKHIKTPYKYAVRWSFLTKYQKLKKLNKNKKLFNTIAKNNLQPNKYYVYF